MSNKFIEQVRSIVMSNLADENFGANNLASLLGLSTSQALRKIKANTGKSATQYIRELRLKEAAQLIDKTDLTFAEISYKTGFGSPSYFNKIFIKHYGITPSDFKARKFSDEELESLQSKRKFFGMGASKVLLSVIAILILITAGFFIITNIQSNKNTLPNSIAVLPFKDLSPEDTQWFCDGVSDNILHSLSQVKGLTVTSFTSSSTYRNSEKQIPVIAKELGVSYVLEGSVTLANGKIKVIAQLIDSSDKHIWSKEYHKNFDDVIEIQKNVAQEVMQQLKITLSPQEEVVIAKYPTENMEAYNLHLRGRLINGSRSFKDLKNNIELNKRAIKLDSTFTNAYAEVAQSYCLIAHRHSQIVDPLEARAQALFYANKALQIDPNTSRALVVKGSLFEYIDWDKAKTYFEKAASLDPNDDQARIYLGSYFEIQPTPDYKRALEQYRIAYKLNPLSRVTANNLCITLINQNKIEEAEQHFKKIRFLNSEFLNIIFANEIIANKNKDWASTIPILKAKIEKDPNNTLLYIYLTNLFRNVLNDNSSSIKYAKKGYEIDSTKSFNTAVYLTHLIEGEKFKEANKLMRSDNYKSIIGKKGQLDHLWFFHYHKEEYQIALVVLMDSLYNNQYWRRTVTYAQLEDRKKVDSMNKRYPWGTGRITDWYVNRAILHAILKDSDSMYYYLLRIDNSSQFGSVNVSREFDSYRKEERFKAILKKWYLPVPRE